MDFITYKPIEFFSQFFIPFILVVIPIIIASYITIYLKNREKSQYIRILRTNFPVINSYLNAINSDKEVRIGLIPMYIAFGFFAGAFFELLIYPLLKGALVYILNIEYIGKIILFVFNNFTGLTANIFLYAYLYIISGLIFLGIWLLWCELLKSKNLGAPKIKINKPTKPNFQGFPSLKFSSMMAYLSICVFLGAIIGINILLFIAFLGVLAKFGIIPSDFSLNFDTIVGIYTSLEKEVHNLNIFAVLYLLGAFINIMDFFAVYRNIKLFSNEVKRLFINFFKYDFPEVNIKTENNEVKGQLKDFTNKYLVTISEKNIIKIVSWNKIEVMEANKINLKK